MKAIQDEIKRFNDARGWSGTEQIKDLLLNINEEIGEFWNIIKWVDLKTQEELIKKERAEVENFIGDLLYLAIKISYLCNVDSEKAIKDVMAEYEQRFPVKAEKYHGNKLAGGIDLKKDSSVQSLS